MFTWLEVFFTDRITDASKPGNPYSYVMKNLYAPISNAEFTQYNLALRHVYVDSDDGWI